MKKFSFLLILLAFCVSFASCSKDEPNGSSKSLVGTWGSNNHYYGGSDYYTFRSNGTYSWECPGSWFEPESGHYSYNNGLLIIVNNEGTSWTYLVQFANKDTFILTDEDGYSYTYSKE